MSLNLEPHHVLPEGGFEGTFVGRIWNPSVSGPSTVLLRNDGVFDISSEFATMSHLWEHENPLQAVRAAAGVFVTTIDQLLQNSLLHRGDTTLPHLLSPIDLQVVKAAGVTFAVSMLERVIEERARGNAEEAARIRDTITAKVGSDFGSVVPGSAEAAELKRFLVDEGMWSQYLEVGIGPDAEIFTKAPVLATVGFGAQVGVYSKSSWNNPEPEVVLAVTSQGDVIGATLGNDVNLRDVEGRSALLLGKAKDNNASAAVGPWVRLFDDTFSIEDVRQMQVTLVVQGQDGFTLEATSDMTKISRDPLDLVTQLIGKQHQYPDGAVLYLGTLFAPVKDRDQIGAGFTHKVGDQVHISSPLIGTLVNEVQHSEDCAPWDYGLRALMVNLTSRGLL